MTEINPMKILKDMRHFLTNPNFYTWVIFCLFIYIIFFFLADCVIPKYYKYKHETKGKIPIEKDVNINYLQPKIEIQRVIAVITSATIVLVTCYIYQWICERFPFLIDFYGIILIVLILFSNFINNHCIRRMKLCAYDQEISDKLGISKTERDIVSNIRLVGSLVALILEIVNFIVFEINIPLLTCILALVLSRFIYFDTTSDELSDTIKESVRPYLLHMVVALILIAINIGSGIIIGVIDKGINGIIIVLVFLLKMYQIIVLR